MPRPAAAFKTLADAERAHINAMLRRTNWVIGGRRGAAAKLGLPRTSLIAKMEKLGISREHRPGEVLQMPRVSAASGADEGHNYVHNRIRAANFSD